MSRMGFSEEEHLQVLLRLLEPPFLGFPQGAQGLLRDPLSLLQLLTQEIPRQYGAEDLLREAALQED